jgi:hypothetical protein
MTHLSLALVFPNLHAALGLAQLEVNELRLWAQRHLVQRRLNVFSVLDYFLLVAQPSFTLTILWLVCLRLTFRDLPDINTQCFQLLEVARLVGLHHYQICILLHEQLMYHACPAGSFLVACDQNPRLLNLIKSTQFLLWWDE